ncbi:MAG: tetratricopeptide repeat protein [Alphaproteobacteria bacterium]
MALLGSHYEDGIGVPVDLQQSVQWYLRAADHLNGRAMLRLGVMHEKGLGVDKNAIEALKWYMLAGAVLLRYPNARAQLMEAVAGAQRMERLIPESRTGEAGQRISAWIESCESRIESN